MRSVIVIINNGYEWMNYNTLHSLARTLKIRFYVLGLKFLVFF